LETADTKLGGRAYEALKQECGASHLLGGGLSSRAGSALEPDYCLP
jgi:hypothetical protein